VHRCGAGDRFAASQCLSGKVVRLYLNSRLVFAYNATSRRATETAGGDGGGEQAWPVFRDHQHRIQPTDTLAIGCCVDANSTDDYGSR